MTIFGPPNASITFGLLPPLDETGFGLTTNAGACHPFGAVERLVEMKNKGSAIASSIGRHHVLSTERLVLENKRAHFRVKYPAGDRPAFEVHGRRLEVLDLSEQGIRLAYSQDLPFEKDATVAGTITFRDRARCSVAGVVLRSRGDGTAMQLVTGISLARIHEEQRCLIRRYRGTD